MDAGPRWPPEPKAARAEVDEANPQLFRPQHQPGAKEENENASAK